jgi:hypothetical protein
MAGFAGGPPASVCAPPQAPVRRRCMRLAPAWRPLRAAAALRCAPPAPLALARRMAAAAAPAGAGAPTTPRGAFIVFEGADRAGKSTQAARLVESLRAQGVAAESWRFPDRTSGCGRMIDAYLKSQSELDDAAVHLLFSANRWEKRRVLVYGHCAVGCAESVCAVFVRAQRRA